MSEDASELEYSSLVHQAGAMVSAQSGFASDEALVVLHETAAATDETLEVVAELVVSGQVRFDAS